MPLYIPSLRVSPRIVLSRSLRLPIQRSRPLWVPSSPTSGRLRCKRRFPLLPPFPRQPPPALPSRCRGSLLPGRRGPELATGKLRELGRPSPVQLGQALPQAREICGPLRQLRARTPCILCLRQHGCRPLRHIFPDVGQAQLGLELKLLGGPRIRSVGSTHEDLDPIVLDVGLAPPVNGLPSACHQHRHPQRASCLTIDDQPDRYLRSLDPRDRCIRGMQEQTMTVRSHLKVLIAEQNVKRLKVGQPPLTQRQIAQESGLPLSVVSGLTSGRAVRVDFKTLDKLCRFFNVEPGDLLEYVSDEQQQRGSIDEQQEV
jgi:putative transcriptional regulator